MSKKLNATFDIENDLAEHKLRQALEGLGAKYLRTIPNTDHLKEDKNYKALIKSKKQAQKNIDKYIDSKR